MCQTSIHVDDSHQRCSRPIWLQYAGWLIGVIVPNTLAGKAARNLQTTEGFEHR